MSEVNNPNRKFEIPSSRVPWKERLEDHNNKIEEYLENCIFRGCSVDGTIYQRKVLLQSIFQRVPIADSSHPDGQAHLLVWGLLDPDLGAHYLSLIISSMMNDELALATKRKYMGDLHDFCTYVLAKPHIPGGNGLSIIHKYGPMQAPFSKYDLPIHAADRPERNRYALAPDLRNDFVEFLRLDFLPNQRLPHIAARTYTAIILQTEIGARVSELLDIRSEGDNCDIDTVKRRVRLFGKGASYTGKRLRWVPLSPLAFEVLTTFQRIFKPMFPKSPQSDYLFLNEDGSRLTKFWYWKTFRKVVELAKQAGVEVPADLRPHDLRRTFATNKLEANPLAYRKVLKHLGHRYPSSAAPYLIATDEDVAEEQEDLMDILIDPEILKRRKN